MFRRRFQPLAATATGSGPAPAELKTTSSSRRTEMRQAICGDTAGPRYCQRQTANLAGDCSKPGNNGGAACKTKDGSVSAGVAAAGSSCSAGRGGVCGQVGRVRAGRGVFRGGRIGGDVPRRSRRSAGGRGGAGVRGVAVSFVPWTRGRGEVVRASWSVSSGVRVFVQMGWCQVRRGEGRSGASDGSAGSGSSARFEDVPVPDCEP